MNQDRLVADISRTIWGYVLSTFDPDSDDIPLSETSFTYSMYHYAALDVLRRYRLQDDVLDIFIPTAAFLMNADPLHPSFGIMLGQVSSALRFFESDNLSPVTIDGAHRILSQKYIICSDIPKTTFDSFLGYKPTDSECELYVKNSISIRKDIEKLILTSNSNSDNYHNNSPSQHQNSPHSNKSRNIILSLLLIAVSIIVYLNIIGILPFD